MVKYAVYCYSVLRMANVNDESQCDWLHGFPGLFADTSEHIFLVVFCFYLFYTFQLSVPCGRLSWLTSAFKHTLKYHLVSYGAWQIVHDTFLRHANFLKTQRKTQVEITFPVKKQARSVQSVLRNSEIRQCGAWWFSSDACGRGLVSGTTLRALVLGRFSQKN